MLILNTYYVLGAKNTRYYNSHNATQKFASYGLFLVHFYQTVSL